MCEREMEINRERERERRKEREKECVCVCEREWNVREWVINDDFMIDSAIIYKAQAYMGELSILNFSY